MQGEEHEKTVILKMVTAMFVEIEKFQQVTQFISESWSEALETGHGNLRMRTTYLVSSMFISTPVSLLAFMRHCKFFLVFMFLHNNLMSMTYAGGSCVPCSREWLCWPITKSCNGKAYQERAKPMCQQSCALYYKKDKNKESVQWYLLAI